MQDTFFLANEAPVGGAIRVAEKTHSSAAPGRRTASLSSDGHRSTGSPRLPHASTANPGSARVEHWHLQLRPNHTRR